MRVLLLQSGEQEHTISLLLKTTLNGGYSKQGKHHCSELKELRRVFDYLADYVPKKKIYKQLNPLLERRQKVEPSKKASFDTKIQDKDGNLMTEDQIDAKNIGARWADR